MRISFVLWAVSLTIVPAAAQAQAVTTADYARAERFLRARTAPLVYRADVDPQFLPQDRFWYRSVVAAGHEFVLIDPSDRTRAAAFNHAGVASALSSVRDTSYAADRLPFDAFEYSADGESIVFDLGSRRYTCDVNGTRCTEQARGRSGNRNEVFSPDGRLAAFIRNHNLWMRDASSEESWPVTTDGVQDFGYATDNAGWTKSDRPVLLWSPDSRKIATFQHDARGVGEMYLVTTNVGHPTLEAWKYPLPEDSVVFRIHRVIIDVTAPEVTRLQMPPDVHRSTTCDHIRCGGTFTDVEWSADASQVAFISSSRDHKDARLRVANAETGVVRDVMREGVETFYESGFDSPNWRFLPSSNEVIWYSQRDDWGHLYLYDLPSGRLKHRITQGDWNVLEVLRVDEGTRTIYFTGVGREPGDPYFQYLYSVGLDGDNLRLLTPDSANHRVTLSPSGRYFVDSYSTPVDPPVTVVRDARGGRVMPLEQSDISRLLANGWQAPIPFTVKARDGATDLYGLMYRPTGFDSTRSYPIVNYLYPGPQSGSVGSRSFNPSRGDKQAIAELGFIVVEVDAMGTPFRSKSFHETYYGDMGDNGLPDQMAMIRQLAQRHRWMDLDRVGIYGHSGGGFAAADAIMRYPDFYKVAVSQAGNHDNRNYEDDWGEKWQGLLETRPDGSTNYDNQANQLLAENLRGKLLLAHGTLDNNVPPYNTLLVVDALIAANKTFDLIMFPNRRHGFGNEPYMMRRRWDYFVEHLLGQEPPPEYRIGGGS